MPVFMRYSAHGGERTPGSERPSRRCTAHADPGATSRPDRQRRATAFPRARDRASEAAFGQVASDAVRAEVREAGPADRAIGVATGGTGIESQRERVQAVRTDFAPRFFW